MEHEWLSVEQVARQLGLHVRTVRGYIRDGRLKAVRIGKQYRIAQADLELFTGPPADANRPQVDVSTIIGFHGIAPAAADRLSTLLVAGAQLPRSTAQPVRVQTVFDDAHARLKVIVLGGVADTARILQTIDDLLGPENGLFPTRTGAQAAHRG